VSAHQPEYLASSFIRARAPQRDDDYLRSVPDQDPYGDSDDGGLPIQPSPVVAPVAQRTALASASGMPMSAAPRPQVPVRGAAATRRRAGLFSRIGSSLKRAWSGFRSLFGAKSRDTGSALTPAKGSGFWNTPHSALAGNDAERQDPFVKNYSLHKNLRADPYAGLADPDELGRPDSPSPRSQPYFNGAFATPQLGQTPPSFDDVPRGTVGEESVHDAGGDSGVDNADAMYDAMPRSGSFIGQDESSSVDESQLIDESLPVEESSSRGGGQSAASPMPAAPSPAPRRTGFEILGRARPHYLDEMSAENQRRLWAEAEGD
jgi:hypothetical protein